MKHLLRGASMALLGREMDIGQVKPTGARLGVYERGRLLAIAGRRGQISRNRTISQKRHNTNNAVNETQRSARTCRPADR